MIPPGGNAAFVAAMEEVLAVYARPVDPRRPLVCFDEAGKDLKAPTHLAQPVAPGRAAREDSEYARHGSRNLFLACAPHLGWRQIVVTAQRTAIDFAHALRDLVDGQFPQAERIVLVLDHLNTHTPAALYHAFPPAEAWRILERIEWHYTHPRLVAEPGRVGVVGPGSAVPGPAHPRSGHVGAGSGGLGGGPQRRAPHALLALHQRGGADPIGLALPVSRIGHFHHVGVLRNEGSRLHATTVRGTRDSSPGGSE